MLIGPAVRRYHFASPSKMATNPELSVATARATRPYPTGTKVGPMGGDRADAHLRPEANYLRDAQFLSGIWAWGKAPTDIMSSGNIKMHRKVTPFGVVQPEVIGLAAASIIQEGGA